METFRHTRMLARAVLVWFAVYVGVSVASPVVSPRAMATICTGSGALMLAEQSDAHGNGTPAHSLDCPLCISLAPPPYAASVYQPPVPGHVERKSLGVLSPALLLNGPSSARGPPTLS